MYFAYIGEPSPLSIKGATGLPGNTVRLLDTGESASNSNFLMREFGYQVGPRTIMIIRILTIVMTFLIPSIILFNLEASIITLAIVAYIGTIAERWLFFAEARHVVNLFYGRDI